MNWAGAMINMLRVLIDDNAYQGSYKYSDSRLTQILCTAAMYACQELTFKNEYDVDIVCCTITPDAYDIKDKTFMNMVVLKAACMVDQGVYREKAALAGLEAKCGPAVMKTLGHLEGFNKILKVGPCGMYEELKKEQMFSGENLNELVHFVLSPFVGNDFDPVCAFSSYSDDRNVR